MKIPTILVNMHQSASAIASDIFMTIPFCCGLRGLSFKLVAFKNQILFN